MKLRGDFVDIMCQVNPYYEQHVRYENGEKVLYILVIREIYGCIESALLWYNLFSTTIQGLVFEIKTYHKCVANKVLKVTQCTIAWYVDDNKLLHTNPEVISYIINEVKKSYGELSVVRGKKHTFTIMYIQIKDSTIKFDVVKRLKECI